MRGFAKERNKDNLLTPSFSRSKSYRVRVEYDKGLTLNRSPENMKYMELRIIVKDS